MAEVSIRKMKDLATVDLLASGAGVTVSLVGGEALGGALSGVFVVPETDVLKTAGIKAVGKLMLGVAGAFVATQKGTVGKLGVGMALGGVGGAIADIVAASIQTTAPATTGATVYSMAKRMVRPMRALPMRALPMRRAMSTGRIASGVTSQVRPVEDLTPGLEILPRD